MFSIFHTRTIVIILSLCVMVGCGGPGKPDSPVAETSSDHTAPDGQLGGPIVSGATFDGGSRGWIVSGAFLATPVRNYSLQIMLDILIVDLDVIGSIDEFSKENWETRPGEDGQTCSPIMLYPLLADGEIDLTNDLRNGLQEPNGPLHCRLSLLGATQEGEMAKVLTCSFRLKGQHEWIVLSDLIELQDDNKHFRIQRCVNCNTLLRRDALKCEFCSKALSEPADTTTREMDVR